MMTRVNNPTGWLPATLMLLATVTVLAGPASPQLAACFMRSPLPVTVWLDHIHVDITDNVAVKTYDCTFKNPNNQAVVGGTCYMELEPGAQVDNMSVLVDGKEMKAEILDVDKAKKVFTDIVKNGGSPALLEYFGNQLIQTQVPRVAPGGTVTVKLTYTMVLPRRAGLTRLQMLNTNPKALMQPLKSAGVTVNIKSRTPIKNVYCPTHKVEFAESEGWDVTIKWAQENYMPKHPFVLYYQTAEDPIGASLLAHREIDEEGYFMMMLSPTMGQGTGQITESQILPKDIVFCTDTSGSMIENKKMEQARGALKYCVEHLRDGDRFNIVDFSTEARSFQRTGLVEVNETSRGKALRYIDKLAARGGTAIEEALLRSLTHLSQSDQDDQGVPQATKRVQMVVFATDGLPTIGERSPEKILQKLAKKNDQDVRIFVFGEGTNVNTKLLDFLALDNRGEADYILPEEDITQKISQFFDRVGSPVMTDVQIDFGELEVRDVYPRRIADVYRGEQVVVFGRYAGSGPQTIQVTGNYEGQRKTFLYDLEFPEASEDDKTAFVPRLWAGKKVDYLLTQLRQNGMQDKELVQEVTYLAKRFGIVTPYTSFLVTDDIATQSRPAQLAQKFGARFQPAAVRGAQPTSGLAGPEIENAKRSVMEADQQANLRREVATGRAGAFEEAADAALTYARHSSTEGQKGKDRTSSLSTLRYIGSKTFYKSGEMWYESDYEANKVGDLMTIKVGSDEYIDLLLKNGRIAKYLALGDVVLQINGLWYQFKS